MIITWLHVCLNIYRTINRATEEKRLQGPSMNTN